MCLCTVIETVVCVYTDLNKSDIVDNRMSIFMFR